MKFRNIFITVGTTEFNDLIRKIAEPEIYEIFKNHFGCKNLKIQLGNGENISFDDFLGIDVEVFTLKDSIADDIEAADLIISHAGAGTCIDVLNRGKPLIVVINETLMNNHQTELAEQLTKEKFLFHTTVEQLPDFLRTFDVASLKTYEKGNVDQFIEYLDDAMGFV